MTRILANPALLVAVITLAIAGDAVRDSLGVPIWIGLVIVAGAWSAITLVATRPSWRTLPRPLIAVYGWWVVSPAWSPYAPTSLGMVGAALLAASIVWALVTTLTADTAVRFGAIALRLVLIASLVFEVGVALSGHPVYPAGLTVTPTTPIEAAWSRGAFFDSNARIQGVVGNANVLGMLALVALVVGVVRLVVSGSWRRIALVDVALAALVIVRTASATVTLTLVGVLAVVGLAALARRRGTAWRVALVAALAGIVGGVVLAIARWADVTALLGKSPDLTHRFDIWRAVGTRIATDPIIGHGYVGWWPTWEPWFAIDVENGLRVAQAHNLWFDLVLQTGIVGVLLFAAALGLALVRLGRAFLRSPRTLVAIPFLLLVALTVQSLTESRLLHEWGAMCLVAFSIVAARVDRAATSTR